MPSPWSSWKKALSCKTDRDQVVEPHLTSPVARQSRKQYSSGTRNCFRSFASFKDVIHGNSRVVHKQSSSSPSAENNEDGHHRQVLPEDFFVETRSSSAGTPSEAGSIHGRSLSVTSTPLSAASYVLRGTPLRKLSGCYDCNLAYETLDSMHLVYRENSVNGSYCGSPKAGCQKCGEIFSKPDALELHHISQHAALAIEDSRITFEGSVRLLGGLMALGYEMAAILKRSSQVFADEKVIVKIDKLEQLQRKYIQIQGKERLVVGEVAQKLGLDGTYIPRSSNKFN